MGIIINGQNDTIGPVDNSMSLLGTVSIGGTMTIEDFTNIDSVGLITARNGLRVDGDYLRVNTNVDSALELNATDDGPVYSSLRRSGTRVAYYGFGGSGSTFNITNEAADGQFIIDTPSHFSVNTNNAERLRITSAGYIGINETSPDTYLHVKTGTDSALAKLEQTATNGRVQVQYLSPHGDWLQGIVGGTNTGDYLIYTGQAKNLTFYTSGTLRQKIQSDGKIILGGNANQAANRDLSVVAASGNSNEVQIGLQPTNSSGGYNPEVIIGTTANGTYGAHMFFTTRDTSGNRAERLRITSEGDVFIGNIAEANDAGVNSNYRTITLADTSNGAQLHLRGQSPKLFMDVTSSGNAEIYYDTGDLRILSGEPGNAGSTERFRITSGGHVNIGGEYSQTDSKVTIVDVSRPIAEATLNLQSSTTSGAADTGPVLRFYGHSGSEGRYHASIKGAKESGNVGSTAGYLAFNTRPSGGAAMAERLRIRSDGDVVIGTNDLESQLGSRRRLVVCDTTNGALLHLRGQSPAIFFDQSGGNIGKIYLDSVDFAIYSNTPNSEGTERLRITSAGLIGINDTSPDATLSVGGSTAFVDIGAAGGNRAKIGYSSNDCYFGTSSSSGQFIFKNNVSSNDNPASSGTERFRIRDTGPISGNPTSGDGDNFAATALKNDANAWIDIFRESWIGNSGGWGSFWAGSSGAAYRRVPSDNNPNEFVFVGAGAKRFTFDLDSGGNAYFDGTLSQNNYDYAEYFEWEDGNPNNEDRRGYSVFLNANGKIEKATSETSTSDIIGVISGTAAIIGDAAVYDWQGRYEIDEWGTRRKEQVTQVSWTDIDGTKHSYADENDIPSDVVVPDDASRRIHHRYIESSTYDSSQAYVPRDQRREWGIVGLLGKVRVRNDSPKHPNWKYIKTIAGKDLWLIK